MEDVSSVPPLPRDVYGLVLAAVDDRQTLARCARCCKMFHALVEEKRLMDNFPRPISVRDYIMPVDRSGAFLEYSEGLDSEDVGTCRCL